MAAVCPDKSSFPDIILPADGFHKGQGSRLKEKTVFPEKPLRGYEIHTGKGRMLRPVIAGKFKIASRTSKAPCIIEPNHP
jgi:hypothetical protein